MRAVTNFSAVWTGFVTVFTFIEKIVRIRIERAVKYIEKLRHRRTGSNRRRNDEEQGPICSGGSYSGK